MDQSHCYIPGQVKFLPHGYIKLEKKGALIKTLQAKTSADTSKLKFHPLHMQAFLHMLTPNAQLLLSTSNQRSQKCYKLLSCVISAPPIANLLYILTLNFHDPTKAKINLSSADPENTQKTNTLV